MPVIRTYIAYHLGDHLIHLNFMRRVARANPEQTFIHHASNQYLGQLRDVIEDIPNLKLEDLGQPPTDSIDAWRGVDRIWYEHANRNDFVGFHLDWFELLAKRMHVENPIKEPKDMLFDYPSILKSSLPPPFAGPFDVLVINSAPGSGQFQSYDSLALAQLTQAMAKGHKVITTSPVPGVLSTAESYLSVTQIGQLSLNCPTILMIATGPSWPTFNIWNLETITNRIILLTEERIYLSPNTHHCSSLFYATEILKKAGYL